MVKPRVCDYCSRFCALLFKLKEIYKNHNNQFKKKMNNFINRLTDEENQLGERLSKLSVFILSEGFKSIKENQQALLKIQEKAMEAYQQCLIERINDLNKE